VPLHTNAFGIDGKLVTGAVTTFETATATFISATTGHFSVYSRETAPGAGDGSEHAVTGRTLFGGAAVLRSRRD
jgi:hypothetical protein